MLKVFSGFFSDKVKARKPFVILGYASSTLGKFFLYIATSWGYVLVGRVVDRFGKGVRTAPRDALIADSSKQGKRGQAFGLHRAMDSLGAIIGVVIAYFLITRFKGNLRNIFLFSLIPAFLGVLFLFFAKEKKSQVNLSTQKLQFKWKNLDKRLKLFLIFTFIFTLGNSSNLFLLLRAKNAGSAVSQVILFYLAYNIIYCIASYPASRLSDRIGRKKILVMGYFFYGLVYLGFAVNNSLHMYWLLFGIYGLYIGFTEGVEKALVADIAPEDLRATAMGLHATLVGIGLLPASLFAGMLWKFVGPAWPLDRKSVV
jgi:MFS family permease